VRLGTIALLLSLFAAAQSCGAAAGVRTQSGPQSGISNTSIDLDAEMSTPVPSSSASGSKCQRWRSLAAKLGETYAGFRLRHSIVQRACAFSGEDVEDQIWSWPWRHNDVRADLPPQRHARFGPWEMRCGQVGSRCRCALAVETVLVADDVSEGPELPVVSHFVIDAVGGRESVLWRVHVGRTDPAAERALRIGIQLPGRATSEAFNTCGRRGCMTEASVTLSAEVVNSLTSGRPIELSLTAPGSDEPLTGALPVQQFRAGLVELIKLRREEARAMARH